MILSDPPAHILRAYLVGQNVGFLPSQAGNVLPTLPPLDWPIIVDRMGDTPEQYIAVYNTQNAKHGKTMRGEYVEWHGVQVMLRSMLYEAGWNKSKTIVDLFDSIEGLYVSLAAVASPQVGIASVTGVAQNYFINSAMRTSGIITFDKGESSDRRMRGLREAKGGLELFTINFLVGIQQI